MNSIFEELTNLDLFKPMDLDQRWKYIDRFCDKLKEARMKTPDLRLFQMLIYLDLITFEEREWIKVCISPFYVSDHTVFDKLQLLADGKYSRWNNWDTKKTLSWCNPETDWWTVCQPTLGI